METPTPEQKELLEALDLKLKNFKTEFESKSLKADDLNSLKTKFEEFETKSKESKTLLEIKSLTDAISTLELEMKSIKEKGGKKSLSLKSQINEFIEKNHSQIVELKSKGAGMIEFKAVGSMLDSSASNPDGIPELVGVQMAPPTRVNLRTTIVNNLVSIFGTSLASYPYTESVPKDGDYSFIGEAESKSQIDFKIETRYAAPKKLAAWTLLSEESVNDIPGLQSIAYDYLKAQHDLKRQNGILFGDGTGNNLKGATTYGRSFVAGSMATSVTTPNFMDVVNACITDIFTTHNYTNEMPYMANLVMINPIDFYIKLVSAKDAFGHPLYPTASLFNQVTIGGATIVPFEDIPAGKIFVADMSKYNITDFVGYTVKIGWINDNLITNQFVILGESRLHGFVKKLDEQAFIYDDIATIQTAITAP